MNGDQDSWDNEIQNPPSDANTNLSVQSKSVYGYFDDESMEYVITRPDTPLPWINYMGLNGFYGIISNNAGGYTFSKDSRFRRITRFRYNNIPVDSGGRIIYIRDNESAKFWSATWKPIRDDPDEYECRHGLGYTKIKLIQNNIQTKIQYFVPVENEVEIWVLKIKNSGNHSRKISLFSYIEFCLWDAQDDSTNFQRNYNTGEVEIEGNVIYHKTEYRERRDHFAYFSSSVKLDGYETQRESFLGAYRGLDNPIAVEKGATTNSIAHGWSPIGVHQINIELTPGEEKEIIFQLGYSENKDQKFESEVSQSINKKTVYPVIEYYNNPLNVGVEFSKLKKHWKRLLNRFQVNTPDVHTNRMVNIWNQYQNLITFNLSRSASYFESGIGRGMGFRDSNQDILGFVHLIPDRARERILDLAATQLLNGGAYHQYQPLSKRGNNDIGSNFNDDPLWLVLSTTAYIKETGDFDILMERVPFENQPGSEKELMDHLCRSIAYTLDNLGPHGLPLIGRADWNDCLNLNCFSTDPNQSFQTTVNKEGKVAESFFIAGQFVLATKQMASLLNHLDRGTEANEYLSLSKGMEEIILKFGWDGDWFLRAYDDNGDKIGSKECKEGQIFIESQGICIMAGVGLSDGKAIKALDSVNKRLSTPHGIMLHSPPYSQYYLNLGEISSYPPGYKENGSVFCHTNPWIMIAETMVGNGDRAYDYYSRINPSIRESISEIHRCEPYVYAQTIAGVAAPTFGEAKNSWLTGTAAWNFVAITQWILGIRPDYDGLIIDPVIPTDWAHFSATRQFRGVRYKINVSRVGKGKEIKMSSSDTIISGSKILLPGTSIKEVVVNLTIN